MKTKKIQLLVFLCLAISFTSHLFAQTPPSDLSGVKLREWFKANYYDGKHHTLGYDSARLYLYNYIDNINNVITGVYSGYQVNSTYGGITTYPAPLNCEHSIPQSFFNENEPMKSDLHHLFPVYENWNSVRNNNPFGDIDDNLTTKWMRLDQSQSTIPTSNIDEYSEYYNGTFEPREDHKGNLARAIFYFYTMYPTQAGDMSKLVDINTLFKWNLADPVDSEEIARNNKIETYQGNRNPYIDFPDLADEAWGTDVASVPATPDNVKVSSSSTNIKISWRDVSSEDGYYLYKSDDGTNFSLLSTLGANMISYTDSAVVDEVIYYYYVVAYNSEGSSNNSSIVNGKLNSGIVGGTATDLFISEYIEGSSYNKGIEIANFTGADVNLADYSLSLASNGGGWGNSLSLSGTLANDDVYVVVHSSADAAMQAVADLTNSTVINFNGNDAIGLFKNESVIDLLGDPTSSETYAQDQTLVRKPEIISPNTTFTLDEWNVYDVDEFSFLGSHEIVGTDADTEAPTVPAGLTASAVTDSSFTLSWDACSDNVAVTAYQVYKNDTLIETTGSTSVNVTDLKAGTTYTMTVAAKDAAGNISTESSALIVTTSADELQSVIADMFVFNIYPNPVLNMVAIESARENTQFQLFNIEGQIMAADLIQGHSIVVDMTQYESGIYILRLVSANETKAFRIIKR